MTNLVIENVPDSVLVAVDAHAARLGVSRGEYIRRRLAHDAASDAIPVVVSDLPRLAASAAEVAEPFLMSTAGSRARA
jgi:hypothetical protein